jgi:phospholipase D1/2
LDIIKAFSDRWDQQKPFIKLINTSKKMPVRKNGTWVNQLVRSDTNQGFLEKGLQCAFVNSIRNAERFIYIENQYFCGSSPEWKLGQGKIMVLTLKDGIISKLTSKG